MQSETRETLIPLLDLRPVLTRLSTQLRYSDRIQGFMVTREGSADEPWPFSSVFYFAYQCVKDVCFSRITPLP